MQRPHGGRVASILTVLCRAVSRACGFTVINALRPGLLIVAFDALQQTLREFRARQKPCAKRAWMSAILSSVTD